MKSIKELALSRQSAFRHTSVNVPEWDGAKVVLREPSAEAWLHWQDVIKPGDAESELSVSERAHRNLRADVTLFIDVLFDEEGQQVFSKDDFAEVEAVYGPVHARLLRQALNLTTDPKDAEGK
ncbi:phage tail protein [Salmonella enterica subsp. enterica serovar Uganda]|uniref:Phage tail protein n=4 Tax=Salmonella enterica TaxID=28901 RepID=A0A635K8W6_SALSE|nr:phage tail assembly chaperone [Salmonella enterica]EAA8763263.1 phage tail protein [Salmonella enterica subsp. enterica]EAN0662987.1 phage tail protein [Salmonella enterica subsp. enterica serovar Orion]EBH8422087.1 phage tail protein [Salmonella enterica subsp. enterica serovar Isangi]EBH9985380.1 phage tail protein [Salmonella enterica subsp. enterica serovar Amager]EBO8405098.1 phage tail protein [Salmonella enterica subsp. enterica serovar Typhimurium]EBO9121202.1 phage tail protein [S